MVAAAGTSAQKGNGSTPNGRPFVALQTQIDSYSQSIEELEARWQEAEARLDEQGQTLQALVEADRALQELISALQDDGDAYAAQLETLKLELNEKQAAIIGSCAPGSSIRQISPTGTVACEPDDTGAGGSLSFTTTDYATGNLTVLAGANRVAPLFCPSGYRALSGGYTKGLAGEVTANIPDGNGWRVTLVNNTTTDSFVRVFVRCSVP